MAAKLSLLVAGLAALPLWAARAIPTQDGPMHLYNAWVLANLHNPDLGLARHFEVVAFTPYWGALAPLAALLSLLDPFTAEKVLLSLIIAALTLATASLARNAGGDDVLGAAIGAMIGHGFLFAMGFSSYVLAMAGVLALAAWGCRPASIRHAARLRDIAAATLALIALFFAHPFGAPFGAALWLITATPMLRTREPERARRLLVRAMPVALVGGVIAWFLIKSPPLPPVNVRPDLTSPGDRLAGFLQGSFWLAYAPVDALVGVAILAAIAALIVERLRLGDRDRPPQVARALFAAGLASFALYLVLPWSRLSTAFIPERFAPLAILLWLPWASSAAIRRRHAWRTFVLTIFAVAMSIRAAEYREYGARALWILECAPDLAPGEFFVVEDRVDFDTSISTAEHAWARLGVARESVAVNNYLAALRGAYPIVFIGRAFDDGIRWERERRVDDASGVRRITCPSK